MTEMQNTATALLSRLARVVAAEGYVQGLKPVQLQVLRYLGLANRFSRTPRALTEWLGQTKGTVSQTIASLERRGLVSRSGDPADRRIVRLDLTEKGHAALDTAGDASATLMAYLDAEQRAVFETLIARMLKMHLAAHGQRAMGLCRACRHFKKDAPGGGQHRCALLNVPLDDRDAASVCIEQEAA
jgi:DNA-binding MarR family transcriptional regulator